VRFVPAPDFNGVVDAGLTFRAWDRVDGNPSGATGVDVSANGGTTPYSSDSETARIVVNAVNDDPDAVDDDATVDEDSVANVIDVLSNDTDAPDVGETLVLVAAGPAAHGTVLFGSSIVTYTPEADYFGPDSFSYTIGDGNGGDDTATVSVTVTGLNDPPVNAVPGVQATNEDTVLIFSSGNGNRISVNDVDAEGHPLQIILTATNGTLTLNSTAGLSFSTGDGTDDANVTFTGALVAINDALDGLRFAPPPDYEGPASLQMRTDDQGYTGTGGAREDIDEVDIVVERAADLSVRKQVMPLPVMPGTAITYTVVVSNPGPSDVNVATVSDTMPSQIDGLVWTCAASGGATCTASGSGDIDDTVELPEGGFITYTVTGLLAVSARGSLVNTARVELVDPAGIDPDTSNNTASVRNELWTIYLPLMTRAFVSAPDLVIENLVATRNNVEVVVRNQGYAPVTDEFWVDVYVDPDPIPTAVNQPWADLAKEGLVWGVTSEALPLAPGEAIVLVINDAFYLPDYSRFSGLLAEGTSVYGQVDSVDRETTWGAVLETHEVAGGPYNNICAAVSTAGVAGEVERPAGGESRPALSRELPDRR